MRNRLAPKTPVESAEKYYIYRKELGGEITPYGSPLPGDIPLEVVIAKATEAGAGLVILQCRPNSGSKNRWSRKRKHIKSRGLVWQDWTGPGLNGQT